MSGENDWFLCFPLMKGNPLNPPEGDFKAMQFATICQAPYRGVWGAVFHKDRTGTQLLRNSTPFFAV